MITIDLNKFPLSEAAKLHIETELLQEQPTEKILSYVIKYQNQPQIKEILEYIKDRYWTNEHGTTHFFYSYEVYKLIKLIT